MAAEPGKKER